MHLKSMEQTPDTDSSDSPPLHPSAYEAAIFMMVDRRTMDFILELAKHLGTNERFAIDHIVRTYADEFGFDPPSDRFEKSEE
jgi:hypothetical protein